MSLVYLSVSPFCFQDFVSSLLSSFEFFFRWTLYFFIFGLVWWYFSYSSTCWVFPCLFILFGVLCLQSAFCRLEDHSSSLIVECAPCGLGWPSDLWRFPGWGNLCLFPGEWSWILSLWRAMQCLVVSLWVWYTFGQPFFFLMFSVMFLLCWRISVGCLALEVAGFWVELALSVVWRFWGRPLSINVPWGQEFCYGPEFWSWASCLWVLVPTFYSSIKTSATQHRRQNH